MRLEKYQDVDERGGGKSPEAADVWVGDVSSGDRGDPNGTGPIIHISNRRDRVFVKSCGQIIHQVRSYSIKRHPLKRFIPFSHTHTRLYIACELIKQNQLICFLIYEAKIPRRKEQALQRPVLDARTGRPWRSTVPSCV